MDALRGPLQALTLGVLADLEEDLPNGNAWSDAVKAAGVIHTDFEKGFIGANVYNLADLEAHGSENALKAAGKLRQEGKTYVVQDGDIMHILASG